jgi:hypothetical protein
MLVRWVQDFCTNRQARILVNGLTAEVQALPQAGLPQGSARAPILFLFFNADLVQSASRYVSSMGFVDDYSAWVIGRSVEENTQAIQDEIVPILEKWQRYLRPGSRCELGQAHYEQHSLEMEPQDCSRSRRQSQPSRCGQRRMHCHHSLIGAAPCCPNVQEAAT